jgi:hypothetical protein
MKLMYPAEPFGVSTLSLASESPDVNAESNNGLRGQLMEVDLKLLKNLTYHLIKGEPKSSPKEAFEDYDFILFLALESSPLQRNEPVHHHSPQSILVSSLKLDHLPLLWIFQIQHG